MGIPTKAQSNIRKYTFVNTNKKGDQTSKAQKICCPQGERNTQ